MLRRWAVLVDEIRTVTGCPGQTETAVVLLGARWDGDSGVLAPIYFCPVGTILAFSFKIVSAVDCYARLCTESNLRFILLGDLFPSDLVQ